MANLWICTCQLIFRTEWLCVPLPKSTCLFGGFLPLGIHMKNKKKKGGEEKEKHNKFFSVAWLEAFMWSRWPRQSWCSLVCHRSKISMLKAWLLALGHWTRQSAGLVGPLKALLTSSSLTFSVSSPLDWLPSELMFRRLFICQILSFFKPLGRNTECGREKRSLNIFLLPKPPVSYLKSPLLKWGEIYPCSSWLQGCKVQADHRVSQHAERYLQHKAHGA